MKGKLEGEGFKAFETMKKECERMAILKAINGYLLEVNNVIVRQTQQALDKVRGTAGEWN